MIGTNLGPYRILEKLGRGGMATVYKAYQPSLDRYVAVKVLPAHLTDEPGYAERFKREARAVAKLEHPNILPVYDYGQEGDLTYIVMRYMEGGTLKALLGRPLDLSLAVDLIGQIAGALDHAHEHGVVHRDVKPSNVLLDQANRALLTDFGVARIVEATQQITATGVGVGTPAYMSPEQGQGKRVDRRSDVYSLGVVLYEMLTGRVPYEADTPLGVVWKHANEPLPLPRSINAAIPEAVERVVLKAMAKAPEDRYATAGELGQGLRNEAWQAAAEVPLPGALDEARRRDALAEVSRRALGMKRLRKLWWVPVALLLVALGWAITSRTRLLESVLGREPEPVPVSDRMPTAGMVPYDDFEDPKHEGSYNSQLWSTNSAEWKKISQEEGVLVLALEGTPDHGPRVEARNYSFFALDAPMFFQVEFMLEAGAHAASLETILATVFDDPGQRAQWESICGIASNPDALDASAGCWNVWHEPGLEDDIYHTSDSTVDFGTWHTFRTEVDPATMALIYYLDGRVIGSHVPQKASELREAKFHLNVGIYTASAEAVTGYVDNVLVGQLLP